MEICREEVINNLNNISHKDTNKIEIKMILIQIGIITIKIKVDKVMKLILLETLVSYYNDFHKKIFKN